MKQPRKLKRWMKELLTQKGLNPTNWHYIKNTPEELTIINKNSGKIRTIPIEKGA